MCSTTAARIARICRAIEEVAGQAGQRGGPATAAARADGSIPAGNTSSGARHPGRRCGRPPEPGPHRPGGGDASPVAASPADATEIADPGEAPRIDREEGGGEAAAGGDVTERLAAIWAMIAEVDPEMARRLPGYLTAAE